MAQFFPKLPHVEDCQKRIRAFIFGIPFIDSRNAKLVWLDRTHGPTYFFREDPDMPSFYVDHSADIHSQDEEKIVYSPSLKGLAKACLSLYKTGELKGYFTVRFDAMEAWFEEDEQIYVSPRDPYKRVDILPSSRHVRITFNDVELANTRAPRLVFETGQPMRIYIVKPDCRQDLLQPSDLTTVCPYKGQANYAHILFSSGTQLSNAIWSYTTPTSQASAIRNLLSFNPEMVEIYLDGQRIKA